MGHPRERGRGARSGAGSPSVCHAQEHLIQRLHTGPAWTCGWGWAASFDVWGRDKKKRAHRLDEESNCKIEWLYRAPYTGTHRLAADVVPCPTFTGRVLNRGG